MISESDYKAHYMVGTYEVLIKNAVAYIEMGNTAEALRELLKAQHVKANAQRSADDERQRPDGVLRHLPTGQVVDLMAALRKTEDER